MCCRLHSSPAEAAVQQRAKVVKHRLAADDEDPGIHDGVEGVEAESCQVLSVATKWANGVDKTCNLMKERVEVRHSLTNNKHETEKTQELCLLQPGQSFQSHILALNAFFSVPSLKATHSVLSVTTAQLCLWTTVSTQVYFTNL